MGEQDGVRSIRAVGDAEPDFYESEHWARLTHAQDSTAFVATWLDIQCRAFAGVIRGAVVLRTSEAGTFAPVALWPQGIEGSPKLAAVIEQALTQRRVALAGAKHGGRRQEPVFIGHPIIVDDQLYGAAALEVEGRAEAALRELVQTLGWGLGWLETLARRKTFSSKARLVTVLDLLATALQHERFQAAGTAVATELATALGCERVGIGFMKSGHIRLRALSHSAAFGKKTNLVRALEAAMDEAADQLATVVFPPRKDGPFQVTRAHAELVQQHGAGAVCTIPLTAAGQVLGALVLERPAGEEFDALTVELCEHAALLVGPVLDVKRKEDRWLAQKAYDAAAHHLRNLAGPRHTALKVWTGGALAVLLFLCLVKAQYRVTADATLEGTVQRAVAAAMPGYIAESIVRAGDVVKEGQLLAALDDRDLRLERLKWLSARAQRLNELRDAMAGHQRAKLTVLQAQYEQAAAQLALVEDQLARTRVVAPFDGIVVKGDLSQSLGAPVERGNVLFELAPLDSYRIIMKVDERDVTELQVGQRGELALSSMPHDPVPMLVQKITPVSVVEEGRNYFRVEAAAQGGIEKLRPGMEGVAKVEIERRRLIWIWTHKIVHWLRMWLWTWTP